MLLAGHFAWRNCNLFFTSCGQGGGEREREKSREKRYLPWANLIGGAPGMEQVDFNTHPMQDEKARGGMQLYLQKAQKLLRLQPCERFYSSVQVTFVFLSRGKGTIHGSATH